MQSFLTVQPGETSSCVGCHEQRTREPDKSYESLVLMAVRRPPSKIEPITDVPDVIDYPRDVQPVLDQLCVRCHGYEPTTAGGPRAGQMILTGDHGPIAHAASAFRVFGIAVNSYATSRIVRLSNHNIEN